jgi:hypothetical protein
MCLLPHREITSSNAIIVVIYNGHILLFSISWLSSSQKQALGCSAVAHDMCSVFIK